MRAIVDLDHGDRSHAIAEQITKSTLFRKHLVQRGLAFVRDPRFYLDVPQGALAPNTR